MYGFLRLYSLIKNPQHDFQKMGGGEGQRPFGTFLKMHQFWKGYPSLNPQGFNSLIYTRGSQKKSVKKSQLVFQHYLKLLARIQKEFFEHSFCGLDKRQKKKTTFVNTSDW